MATTFRRARLRCALDVSRVTSFKNLSSGADPEIWRGTDLSIEFALFWGNSELLAVSQFTSITCEVKALTGKTGAALMSQTLLAVDLNTGLTAGDWSGGTSYHGLFAFTYSDTNLDLGGQDSAQFWLVISAITDDPVPRNVTLGCATLTVREDGHLIEGETTPAPGDPQYLTAEQTRGLLGAAIMPENPAGRTILLKSPSGAYGRIIGVDDSGAAIDSIISL